MDTEIPFILFLQTLELPLSLIKLLSFLGSKEFYLLFMPFLYWCWDTRLGFRVGLILVLTQGLNTALKIAIHSPRPYWISPEVKALASELSFGMPSGHAQGAVSVLGITASRTQNLWAYTMAFGLCLLIGASRVALGVHFPGDVIVGWAAGGLLLGSFLVGEHFLAKKLRGLSLSNKVLASFLASSGIIALYGAGQAIMGSWQMPAAWAGSALQATGMPIDPLNPLDVIEASGLLFGACAGYALMQHLGGFRIDGPAFKRLASYLLGLMGLLLVWYGSGAAAPMLSTDYAFAYLRAMLAGSWVTIWAPILFIKLKLAKKSSQNWRLKGCS
jgi:membrane-associated phospholipid phosphatase